MSHATLSGHGFKKLPNIWYLCNILNKTHVLDIDDTFTDMQLFLQMKSPFYGVICVARVVTVKCNTVLYLYCISSSPNHLANCDDKAGGSTTRRQHLCHLSISTSALSGSVYPGNFHSQEKVAFSRQLSPSWKCTRTDPNGSQMRLNSTTIITMPH